MTKEEQTAAMIDVYTNLLRIKRSQDKEVEVDNQLCIAKAKLQALGVVVDDLIIK